MSKYYRLSTVLSIDYEYDKGPSPSGYANLKLRIMPNADRGNDSDLVVAGGRFWKVSKKYLAKDAEQEVLEFIPIIVDGVRQGIGEVLTEALDHPVNEVIIYLDEVVVDPVYSTKMAFLNATKLAIRSLLIDARERGQLVLVETSKT